MEKQRQVITIIQKLASEMFKAVRCTRYSSTFLEYCGAYSHMKYAKTPKIMYPETMSEQECLTALQGHIRLENGQTRLITKNQPLYISYVSHGSVSWANKNVFCQGADITIGGETHSGMLVMKSTRVLVEDVDIERGRDDRLVDVTNRQQLGYMCRPGVACISNDATYIYTQEIQLCNLQVIRSVNCEVITNEQGVHFVNRKHKLYFREGSLESQSVECPSDFTLLRTQYTNLYITKDEVDHLPALGEDVDLDLELRTTIEYLEFEVIESARRIAAYNSNKLCSLQTHGVDLTSMLSPFSQNSVVRNQGDYLVEFACTPVQVEFKLHETLQPMCFRNGVIGRLGSELVLLDTSTFVVYDPHQFSSTSCEYHFPALIKTTQGEVISVHPTVRVEKINSVVVQADSQLPVLQHEDSGKSLLYTDKEIIKYNNLIHFARIHQVISAKLVTNVCKSKCGVSLGVESPLLDMSNIMPVGLPDLKSLILDHLLDVGSVCGLFIALLLIMQAISKCWKIVTIECPCRHKPSGQAVVEINTGTATPSNLGQGSTTQLRSQLESEEIDMEPLDTKPRPARNRHVRFVR